MIARLMFSAGMLTALAAVIAVRNRGFISGSPPFRAAIMISLMMRVNVFPRLASRAAFLCLMVAHLECPDMVKPRARLEPAVAEALSSRIANEEIGQTPSQ